YHKNLFTSDLLLLLLLTLRTWHGGSVACTACTVASQQEGHGFDSRIVRCWLWGAGPPQTFSAQVGYLPGLSVWSLHVLPVFTRGFLHIEPQHKNMQTEKDR